VQAEFYSVASALLPLMVLTKVSDQIRRRATDAAEREEMHLIFVAVAIVGEGFALVATATKNVPDPVRWTVLLTLVVCGSIFALELILEPAWRLAQKKALARKEA
jgi:hypothetical protein